MSNETNRFVDFAQVNWDGYPQKLGTDADAQALD
jgi:hypothetical protein